MKNTVLFILLIISNLGWSQSLERHKGIPKELYNNLYKRLPIDQSSFIDLTSYLPNKFVRDGSVDYTDYLQKGIVENKNVKLPNFPVLINDKGLSIYSDNVILFDDKSEIILKPSTNKEYEILRLHSVDNVKIINPVIKGDREKRKDSNGEWGMGIAIRSSNNIAIINANISNCWGDGLYIGRSFNKRPSMNVTVSNSVFNFNRRNGISIVSGKNITIKDVVVSNTLGTNPMSGIDIEPSSHVDEIDNILVKDVNTYNNGNMGLVINLKRLVGAKQKTSRIKVENFIDNNSKVGFYISQLNDVSNNLKLRGYININNITLINNATPMNIGKETRLLQDIKISNVDIQKKGSKILDTLKERVKTLPNININ